MHAHFGLKYIDEKPIELLHFPSLAEGQDYFEVSLIARVGRCSRPVCSVWAVGLLDLMCSCYSHEPQRNAYLLFPDFVLHDCFG
jgi:hypothetical protein